MRYGVPKQTASSIAAILAEVTFPAYEFHVGGTDRLWLRASFMDRCSVTGVPAVQFTRKWYVSEHATKSEIVQTALKCVLTSEEHEVREKFRYQGKAIFGPHFDVDALARICTDRKFDYRKT